MTQVNVKFVMKLKKKKKLLVPKFDGLQKYASQWKVITTHPKVVIGHYYISNTN
jgi:hypothetical protein